MALTNWQFIIDLQDGNGGRDITSLVIDNSISRTRRLHNNLKFASWSISFELLHNTALAALLIVQKKEILLTVNRNTFAYFTGIIRPTYEVNVTGEGKGSVGSTINLEGVDNSYKLQRELGWNGQSDLEIINLKVCDASDQSHSAFHTILYSAGYSSGDIGTIATITDLVTLTIESNKAGSKFKNGDDYLSAFEPLMFEHGYVIYFDETGKINLKKWDLDPATITTTGTMTQADIRNYSYEKTDNIIDRVDVSYVTTQDDDGLIYSVTKSYSHDNSTIPLGTTSYNPIMAVTSFSNIKKYDRINYVFVGVSVGISYDGNYASKSLLVTDDYAPQSISVAGGVATVWIDYIDRAADGTTTFHYRINRSGPGVVNVDIGIPGIYANYTYSTDQGCQSSFIDTKFVPEKYDSKYISSAPRALEFSKRLVEYRKNSQDKFSIESITEYDLGEYLQVTESINGISAGMVQITEITDNTDWEYGTLVWNYKAEPIGSLTVQTTTTVSAPTQTTLRTVPVTIRREVPKDNLIQIPPPPGKTLELPTAYIYWDDATGTLRINGDMYLSGNSTVQGKIAVGGQLSSTIYTAGSAGWAIKADGNAEFFNIKLRGTVDAVGATLGGFFIDSNALYAGTGSSRIQLDTMQGIHMGATTFADAPFRVTLSGALTSTSGFIGGFTIGSSAIGAGTGATRIVISTQAGIMLGNDIFANAPFSVTLAGVLKAESGKIGGFTIGTDRLESAGSGTARIILNQSTRRVEIVDSSNVVKTANGYLNGLPKNDGSGNFGTSDYGFWARSGDKLRIDGAAEYSSGDWIIKADASYQILDGITPSIVRARMGTISGDKGFFVNEANYNADPSLITNYTSRLTESTFFVGNKDAYIRYNSGVLTLNLVTFLISSLATNLKGTFYASNKTGSAVSDSNFSTHAIGITTDTGGTYGVISHSGEVRVLINNNKLLTINPTRNIFENATTVKVNLQLNGGTELLTLVNSGGFICGYNTAGSTRSGYLQFNSGSNITIQAEGGDNKLLLNPGSGHVLIGLAAASDNGYNLQNNGNFWNGGPILVDAKNQWNGLLKLGGNGDAITNALLAQIQTTEGNLHLDSGMGKDLYLNYYSTSGNINSFAYSSHKFYRGTNLKFEITDTSLTSQVSLDILGSIYARSDYHVLNAAGTGWNRIIKRVSNGTAELENVYWATIGTLEVTTASSIYNLTMKSTSVFDTSDIRAKYGLKKLADGSGTLGQLATALNGLGWQNSSCHLVLFKSVGANIPSPGAVYKDSANFYMQLPGIGNYVFDITNSVALIIEIYAL